MLTLSWIKRCKTYPMPKSPLTSPSPLGIGLLAPLLAEANCQFMSRRELIIEGSSGVGTGRVGLKALLVCLGQHAQSQCLEFLCQMKAVPFLLFVWNLKIHYLSSFSCSPVLLFHHDQIRKDGQFKTLNVPSDESLVSILRVVTLPPSPAVMCLGAMLGLTASGWQMTLHIQEILWSQHRSLNRQRGPCWPASTCPGLFRASATTMHAIPGRPTGVHPDVVIWC